MRKNDYTISFYSGKKRKKDGYTTVAILDTYTGKQYKGVAHCNPLDNYDVSIGCKIAESRARKAYLKAEAKEAYNQYEIAKRLLERTKKYAESCYAMYAKEEADLASYIKTV